MDTPSGWQAVAHAEQPPRRSARPARGPRRRRRRSLRGLPRPAPGSERSRCSAVAFGTSGHRGSSLSTTFNDDHIAATSQAIVEYRGRRRARTGRCSSARDTHALSEPAWLTASRFPGANDVHVLVDAADGYTPTPAVSHAILAHNRGRTAGIADGIVDHPVATTRPRDGGFKYNPPHGGPADTDATKWIADAGQRAARRQARRGASGARSTAATLRPVRLPRRVRRRPARRGRTSTRSGRRACGSARTRSAGRASPTGARSPSATASTSPSSTPIVDPQFGFMTLDWDGKIRMDCSSPYAMASLVARRGATRSPRATTPTPTGTASSPPTPG